MFLSTVPGSIICGDANWFHEEKMKIIFWLCVSFVKRHCAMIIFTEDFKPRFPAILPALRMLCMKYPYVWV